MSSDYNALCLSHDPAIVMGTDERTWDAALERGRLDHPRCDLLVGRWSGGLVELCCPGMPVEQDHKPHSGWHRDPVWTDAGLLRIVALAWSHAALDGVLRAALARTPMCWTKDRLMRLRPELGIEVVS